MRVDIVTRGGHPDFVDLPWEQPLAEWTDERLVDMAHGRSRHVVRFVCLDDRVYALKETDVAAAEHEYRVLRDLREDNLPVVEPVGVITRPGPPADAVLVTRYLEFSLPYWYVIGRGEPFRTDTLLDAGVVLLVRLHLDGVFWGDCSLSNVLWRRDAGALAAYMVDAETSERHPTIGDGMRSHDLTIAQENIVGGLLELQAAGRVEDRIDPVAIAEALRQRYDELWAELTRVDAIGLDERWRIDDRIRRINDLGFDVEELSIGRDGQQLSIRPVLVEEGHHARELRRRTGLEVQENQARRLLADIEGFRAWLEQAQGRAVPAAVAAARWLAEIYEPLVESVPADLRRVEAPQLFHQMLEHRHRLSTRYHREVGNTEALDDYLASVLQYQPDERLLDTTGQPVDDDEAGC